MCHKGRFLQRRLHIKYFISAALIQSKFPMTKVIAIAKNCVLPKILKEPHLLKSTNKCTHGVK